MQATRCRLLYEGGLVRDAGSYFEGGLIRDAEFDRHLLKDAAIV